MNGRQLVSFIALTLAPALALSAPAKDLIIWSDTGGQWTSHWVQVTGNKVEVLATRPEAVTSNGSTLWALQTVWVEQKLIPCEKLEDEDFDEAKWTQTHKVKALRAHPLNAASKDIWLIAPPEDPYYGDPDNNDIKLLGGAGNHVMLERIDSGYECGAHVNMNDFRTTLTLGAPDLKDKAEHLSQVANAIKKGTAELASEAVGEDCQEDKETAAKEVYTAGISLTRFTTPSVSITLAIQPGASWAHNCYLEHELDVPLTHFIPAKPHLSDITAALQHIKVKGIFGFSHIKLAGADRDQALARFKDATGVPKAPKPGPAASPGLAKTQLTKGRTLTGQKEYAEAIAAFNAAIAADATLGRAWSGRGYARLQKGDYAEAKTDFQKALKLDSSKAFQAAVWFNLGLVAEKQKDTAAARKAYTQSNAIKPSKSAAKKLKSLK